MWDSILPSNRYTNLCFSSSLWKPVVKDTDIDIVGEEQNLEPASKRLKLTLNQLQCKVRDNLNSQIYSVQLCLEYFSNAKQLATHNCNRLKIVNYDCPICQRSFMCSANLASHMKWHSQVNSDFKYSFLFQHERTSISSSPKSIRDRLNSLHVTSVTSPFPQKLILIDTFKLFIKKSIEFPMQRENKGRKENANHHLSRKQQLLVREQK